nr:unnamed protein product [Callosobruchus analis]
MVLVKEPNMPPLKWRLGRVFSMIPGHDDIAWVAVLKSSMHSFIEPLTHLQSASGLVAVKTGKRILKWKTRKQCTVLKFDHCLQPQNKDKTPERKDFCGDNKECIR